MDNFGSLVGKNILITGASSGIGRQCAIKCSKMGANLILISRNEERLNTTMQLLNEGRHISYSHDLTEFSLFDNIISDIVKKTGKLDGFIHSAGIEKTIPLKMMKPEYYSELFSINVIAGLELSRIISSNKYISNGGGSFVFISSIMSILGIEGKICYCSSKGALLSATKAMAIELIPKHIRVNCVLPAIVATELTMTMFEQISDDTRNEISKMHPMGFGKPEDVANACIFLLSDASSWITGTGLVVDGGYSAK